jgi:hypothetical protein
MTSPIRHHSDLKKFSFSEEKEAKRLLSALRGWALWHPGAAGGEAMNESFLVLCFKKRTVF